MKTTETRRILVTYQQFRMIREVLKARQIYYLAGSASIYVPSRREKYIISHNHKNQPIAQEWPDLNGEMLWMTPGEAARTELERDFGYIKRVGWPSKSVRLFDWLWPMAYLGDAKGELVYTDIVGAYNQIYSRLWLDTCFPRGRGQLSLGPIAGRLAEWKLARNSLVGIIRAREGAGYRGNIRYKLSMGNKFLSPHLWATIQGILNELGVLALSSGGIYINTDGYIHPVSSDVLTFQKCLTDFGIEYRTIVGIGQIRGWGNYWVGTRQTQHYSNGREWRTAPFNTCRLPDNTDPLKLTLWWKGLK